MNIRLADEPITVDSIVDGPGLRNVVWTQGCIHACSGCHNQGTHDKLGGELYSCDDVIIALLTLKKNNGTDKVTFSGGDPMLQTEALLYMVSTLKKKGFNIWVYTGYSFEELMLSDTAKECLKYIDVLVDGKFVEHLKDLTLPFRGSSNQRILCVPSSLQSNSPVTIQRYENAETLANSQITPMESASFTSP